MNNGLYARAGASATATAAAWANRLLLPMTKLSNTYLGFRPGSSPAARRSGKAPPSFPRPLVGRPGVDRRPRGASAGPAALVVGGFEVERQHVGRPLVLGGASPVTRSPGLLAPPTPGRGAPVLGRATVHRRTVQRAQLTEIGVGPAGRALRRLAVPGRRGADGVGADTEGTTAVVGAVTGGAVLLGALRLGRRPRPPRGLLVGLLVGGQRGVLELDGDADVAAELCGQRLGENPAHP